VPIRSVTLRILGDSKDALAKMKAVNAEADKLEKRKVNVHVGMDIDNNDIVAVKAKIAAISKLQASIRVKIDTPGLLADFAKIKVELQALRVLTKDIKIDPGVDIRALTLATNELKKMGLAANTTGDSFRKVGKDAKEMDSIMGSIFKRGNSGFYSFFSFLTGDVKLFAGLLGTISTFHLLFDAILEVAIVWTTAAAAAAAFGVAAIPTVDKIYDHMKNLVTVSKATGQNIPPLTGAFTRLAEAVRPQVYQIFGDALTVMNTRTGLFAKLATDAGSVLEHFAARIAVALRSGGGLNQFLDKASQNLAGLLSGFASFFHIIGSLMTVMPGYAEILLQFGDGLLAVASFVVSATKPFIGAALWIHGFVVWAGLGATVAWALGRALVFLGNRAIGTAIKGIISAGIAAGGMTAEFSIATAVLGAFDVAMVELGAVNPLIWIGAAIGAVAALGFAFRKTENATQAWGDSLQKTVDESKTIGEAMANVNRAVLATAANLGVQTQKLARTQEQLVVTNKGTRFEAISTSRAWAEQAAKVDLASEQYDRFIKEQEFLRGRLTGLGHAFGGVGNAIALMNAAGVTQAEFQDKSAAGWAIIVQKIQATIAGYKAMGQTGGALNNDLAVMDRNITSQYEAMQKLNQAWDQFIGDVTGSQNSFDTVALGFSTLANKGDTVSNSLGHARMSIGGLGKAIDGLTPKDLALNQAFTAQVGQLNTLFDSWRTAGIGGHQFTQGIKAGIDPLVKYARGSKEATAQLVALAQEAGYNGPNSLKSLVKWLGNGHNATQTLKKVTDQATIQESLLTGAMDSQAKAIENMLLGELDKAITKYSSVTTDVIAYGKAIAEQGRQSDAARSARTKLIDDLIETERRAGLGKVAIAELISKITHIPLRRAIEIVEHGTGSFTIAGQKVHLGAAGQIYGGNLPSTTGSGGPYSHGGYVKSGTGPTADDALARVSRGELIVPTKFVNAGLVDHLRGMIPGFASGGLMESGNLGVLSGNTAVAFNRNFAATLTGAMEAAMTRALKSAQAAAASSMFGGSGALGGDEAANRALAQRLFPWPMSMWPAFVDLEMHEAGFNRFARNPSSGAYGIPQALPPTKMPFAAQAAGGSHAGPQLGWMFGYIRDVYGNPLVADAHEHSHNWYAGGTGGAAPGWAWVGENGPELVRMLGGERILDAFTSMRVSRGYARGTEGARGAELINIFRDDVSDRSWREDIRKYLRFINDYYNGRAKNWRDDHIIRQTRAMERTQDRLGGVNKRIVSFHENYGTVLQGLSGYGDLSGLTLGPTPGIGDNVALSGGQGLKMQLGAKLQTLKQFSSALKKLAKMKLPAFLLREIVNMGPDNGLAMANEILSGGASFVKALAGEEAAIGIQERQIARGIAGVSAGGRYDTGMGFINGLERNRNRLKDLFADLGKTLGREAVRWFNVPKNKRPRGFASGGWLTEPVWGVGMSGQQYTFAEYGPEPFGGVAAPGRMPRYRGGDVYNVYVSGDSDPDGAAKRIIQKVSDYKRRHGNQPTGIG